MTNKNFGKLVNEKLEYAPTSFKTSLGIIINPPAEFYYQKGYYSVIDNPPEPAENCYVKVIGYTQNDEEKTITVNYGQIMIPVVRQSIKYSKLKIEAALFKLGKSEDFDKFLDTTALKNDYGNTVYLRKFYDQANDLRSDNEYFETYYKLAKNALNLDDETADNLLKDCIMDD